MDNQKPYFCDNLVKTSDFLANFDMARVRLRQGEVKFLTLLSKVDIQCQLDIHFILTFSLFLYMFSFHLFMIY